ncbi:MAG: outer membrane lipoprotein-sorting protein [Magnetococcales bacterium]|nr:outer membrane lipoprotein-sorting protein [Magnetococcales bacterium]
MIGLWVFLIPRAWADTPSVAVLEETIAKMDRTLNPGSAEYFIKVINEVPGKEPDEYILYAVNKDNKWAGVVTVPEAFKGRAAMRVDNQIWYHVPGELKPRQGELQNSIIHGVLEYRILFRIDDAPYYRPQLISADESRLAVELIPRQTGSNLYNRVMVIDRKLNLPQTETLFSSVGNPLKEITYQDVRQLGSFPPRPSRVVVKSLINVGYTTTMILGWVKPRALQDEVFTPSFFPQVGTLLKSYEP